MCLCICTHSKYFGFFNSKYEEIDPISIFFSDEFPVLKLKDWLLGLYKNMRPWVVLLYFFLKTRFLTVLEIEPWILRILENTLPMSHFTVSSEINFNKQRPCF